MLICMKPTDKQLKSVADSIAPPTPRKGCRTQKSVNLRGFIRARWGEPALAISRLSATTSRRSAWCSGVTIPLTARTQNGHGPNMGSSPIWQVPCLERDPQATPLDWAATQSTLGTTLLRLGERESDAARLRETIAAWDACLTVLAPVWPSDRVDEVHASRESGLVHLSRAVQ